jgi:hypothetical protein
MKLISVYKTCLGCLVLALIQACSLPYLPDAKTGNPGTGKIVVVGKFELNPPLTEREKELGRKSESHTFGGRAYEIFFSVTHRPLTEVNTDLLSEHWKQVLSAFWSETYFKMCERKKTYLNAGVLYADVRNRDRIWLPGRISFTPPVAAKAVYIGTVRYTRDEFWNIIKIQIIDEYRKANAEFRKRFGRSVTLRKALLR